jgi:hypothetical protein
MLVIPMMVDLEKEDIFLMPIQVIVPMMVATIEEISAISIVLYNACIISLLLKRATYHLNENPPHFALVLLELNERTISVAMGAYRNMSINTR